MTILLKHNHNHSISFFLKSIKLYHLLLLSLLICSLQSNLLVCLAFCLLSFLLAKLYRVIFSYLSSYVSKYRQYIYNGIKSLLNNSKFTPIFKIIYIYMAFIFNLRYFFRKERPEIIYIVGLIIMCLSFFDFSGHIILICYAYCCIFGLNLISYDNLGSIFSEYLFNNSQSSFSLGFSYFLTSAQTHKYSIIRRFAHTASVTSLILGKTPMTATGRAYLFVGLVGGTMTTSVFVYNQHLQRAHDTIMQETKHNHDSSENEKARAIQTQTNDINERVADLKEVELKTMSVADFNKKWHPKPVSTYTSENSTAQKVAKMKDVHNWRSK